MKGKRVLQFRRCGCGKEGHRRKGKGSRTEGVNEGCERKGFCREGYMGVEKKEEKFMKEKEREK